MNNVLRTKINKVHDIRFTNLGKLFKFSDVRRQTSDLLLRTSDLRTLTSSPRIRKFLSFLLLFSTIGAGLNLFLLPLDAEASWWDGKWHYRKPVSITNSSGSRQTDFQVSITVDTASLISTGRMNSTCSDLRVATQGGIVLPHWIEEDNPGCNNGSTNVWVKVPDIPTTGITLYVYYGNSGAPDTQDGDQVFEFFDDFSGTLSTSKWTQDSGTWATTTFGGKEVLAVSPTADSWYLRAHNTSFPNTSEWIIETSFYSVTAASAHPGVMFYATSGYNDHFYFRPHQSGASGNTVKAYYNGSVNTADMGNSNVGFDTWYKTKVTLGTYGGNNADIETNGFTYTSITAYEGVYDDIGLAAHAGSTNYYDYIFVRKGVSLASEPSAGSLGTEEVSESPLLHYSFDEGFGTTAYNSNGSAVKRDPVAYYKMDETALDTCSDGLDTCDDTINGNNGTAQAGITSGDIIDGKVGKAINFDNGSTDRIGFADVSDHKPSNITISLWTRFTTIYDDWLVENHTTSTGYTNGYLVRTDDAGVVGCMFGNGSTNNALGDASGPISTGTWYHVSCTYDGSTVKMYLNGELQGSASLSGGIDYTGVQGLSLGASYNGTLPMDGDLDEVKVYDYALTAQEVWGEYANSNGHMINMDPTTDWVEGAVAQSGNRPMGKALDFDGINDYVSAADNAILDLNDNFSIGAWFKSSNIVTNSAIVEKANSSQWNFNLYGQTDNKIRFGIYDGSNVPYVDTPTGLNDDEWHHVVAVRDIISDELYMYLDGELVDSTEDTTTVPIYNDLQLTIGASDASGSNIFFSGQIDEVKIYPYARSATQVKTDYNSAKSDHGASSNQGAGDKYTGNAPIGEWNMDEGEGFTAYDTSGNGNHGELTNMEKDEDWAKGKVGTALDFDGTNDYVDLGSIDLGISTGAFTFSVWIYKTESTAGVDYDYIFDKQLDRWVFGFRFNDHPQVYLNSTWYDVTGEDISLNEWHHITITRDGSGNLEGYIDGVAKNQGLSSSDNVAGTSPAVIGSRFDGAFYWFPGKIDQFRIYDYARSVDQIHEDMMGSPVAYWKMDEGYRTTVHNSKESVDEEGLISWWKFDEGSGSDAYDEMEVNHGTITGAAWVGGQVGNALDFEDVDYVDVSSPDFSALDSEITISMWQYGDATIQPQNDSIIEGRDASSNRVFNVHLPWGSEIVYWDAGNSGASYDRISKTATASEYEGQWNHWAFTKNAGTGEMKMYLNGALWHSDTGKTYSFGTITQFKIGSDYAGTGNYDGMIDDVRIYNRELSAGEVLNQYNSKQGTMINMDASSDWIEGNFDKAIDFDGTNDYVEVRDTDATDFGTEGFALEAWVNTTAVGSVGHIVSKSTYTGSPEGVGYSLYVSAAGAPCIRMGIVGSTYDETCAGSMVADGAWHHIVGVVDVVGAQLMIYVDGVLTGGDNITATLANDHNQNVFIGAFKDSDGTLKEYFGGQIDEVKIYNYVVTADEILLGYNSPQPAPLFEGTSVRYGDPNDDPVSMPAPAAWYKFDEASGLMAVDSSGNNKTGTLVGMDSDTSWVQGKLGKTLDFDGNASFVEIPNDILTSNTAFTISGWIYPEGENDTAEDFQTVFDLRGQYNVWMDWWEPGHADQNQIIFNVYDGDTINSYSGAGSFPVNEWHHYTATFGSNTMKVYVDGKLMDTDSQGSPGAVTTHKNKIGKDYFEPDLDRAWFNGKIDNVKVWNATLTPSQIDWEYNQGKPSYHWKMDQTEFQSCSGGSTDVCDSGPFALHGTSQGTMTIDDWVDGKYWNALDFDGGDDFVDFGDTLDFATTDQFTLSAWVKTDTDFASNQSYVGGKGYYSSSSNASYYVLRTSAADGIPAFLTRVNTNSVTATGDVLSPNEWYHLVGVYDNGTIKLYVDGVLKDTETGATLSNNGYSFIIGASNYNTVIGGRYSTDDIVDEFRLYNYALTADQVLVDYNNGQNVRYGD